MIRQITFPVKAAGVKPNEYNHHYLFIKKYAEYQGIEVIMGNAHPKSYCSGSTYFSIEVDGQQAIIDYSDHEPLSSPENNAPCFKYHYYGPLHGRHPLVYPVGPMLDLPNVEAYRRFFQLTEENIYECNSNIVLNCQRPRLNARVRRSKVQRMLRSFYGAEADTSFIRDGQEGFWNKHGNCLVAVCVPGARNNMLDRGHYEQLALGVCTISPVIRTVLPGNRELIPGTHYLACKDDYSDLIQIIEWCKKNRAQCREIGRQAGNLFKNHCRPEPYWKWVAQCLARRPHLSVNN